MSATGPIALTIGDAEISFETGRLEKQAELQQTAMRKAMDLWRFSAEAATGKPRPAPSLPVSVTARTRSSRTMASTSSDPTATLSSQTALETSSTVHVSPELEYTS